MAVIKCKMCGGDLAITEGSSVAVCEYCGSRQTVPNADNEKKLTLFARANRLRLANEFDKAAGVYESIIAENPEEAEAYWGLVLCTYGIEYVDDPATGKKIPTCHRSSFDSVLEDDNFEQACENADSVARAEYRAEAKEIERLRQGILEVSGKEEPYDIFICYKETAENGERTVDSVIAQDVYDALTQKGYRVFFSRISLEDKLGTEYEPYIFAALNSAKVMLAFGTDYEYYNAVWVKNEWSRFLKLMEKDKTKHLVPCYRNLDPYDMPKEFQRLQGQDMGKVGAVQDLLRGIEKILPRGADQVEAPQQVVQQVVQSGGPNVTAMLQRGQMALEDGEWDKAKEYFDQALNMDAACSEAWLGLAMAETSLHNVESIGKLDNRETIDDLENNANFKKSLRFSNEERKNAIVDLLTQSKSAVDEKERIEAEKQSQAEKRCAAQRKRIAPAQNMIYKNSFYNNGYIVNPIAFALRADGTVVATAEYDKNHVDADEIVLGGITKWRDIVSLTQGLYGSNIYGLRADGTVKVAGRISSSGYSAIKTWENVKAVYLTSHYTYGLRSDGTVLVTTITSKEKYEEYESDKPDVSTWTDVASVYPDSNNVYGLRINGTVLAAGKTVYSEVSSWSNVVKLYGKEYGNVYGLRSDGTVLVARTDYNHTFEAASWTDIVSIYPTIAGVYGLRADGTVVAAGSKEYVSMDVSGWTNVVAVYPAIGNCVYGLQSNGKVLSAGGNNKDKLLDVSEWTDVVAVYPLGQIIYGLRSDGTVLLAGESMDDRINVSRWTNVVAIYPILGRVYGLREDGTVVADGSDENGMCDVGDWKLFNNIDTLPEEREQARQAALKRAEIARQEKERQAELELKRQEEERKQRIEKLSSDKVALQSELEKLKGLFNGRRRKEIEEKMQEIDREIDSLKAR